MTECGLPAMLVAIGALYSTRGLTGTHFFSFNSPFEDCVTTTFVKCVARLLLKAEFQEFGAGVEVLEKELKGGRKNGPSMFNSAPSCVL